ncbi:CAAX amino terminal protease [Penicillium alfredii]|uniref:intramembrane prenyl-peptidase Rce1 n=1 Tax=Penicillium alfredii TaxID=1506179 RepID=A0A9W9K420_9EURO|nr:CAAX amino terminal protease [Penicillium alfredii]KAJ5092294.1 CAAX amino terminal protease [Penicillium alfredii]
MAPVGLLARLRSLYMKHQDEPALSLQTLIIFSVALTLLYVVPFYLSPDTRPSPSLSRDAPSVIRARIRSVTGSCIISSLLVLWVIVDKGHSSVAAALRLLGWWPIGLGDIARSLLLTMILFVGPLFERAVVEGEWRTWFRGSKLAESLGGWIGWRNYVAGPVTEEVIFRSVIVPLHLLARVSPGRVVFVAPLYFGIAHVHHFYEFRLTHPDTSILAALLRSILQFAYTTVFGWYATFLYLRTGSLPAVILVHSFCNWCGLPRFWGRVDATESADALPARGKEDPETTSAADAPAKLGIGWSVTYYALLVAGAVGFSFALWPLTESYHGAVPFE